MKKNILEKVYSYFVQIWEKDRIRETRSSELSARFIENRNGKKVYRLNLYLESPFSVQSQDVIWDLNMIHRKLNQNFYIESQGHSNSSSLIHENNRNTILYVNNFYWDVRFKGEHEEILIESLVICTKKTRFISNSLHLSNFPDYPKTTEQDF